MKQLIITFAIFIAFITNVFSNGVGIIDGKNGIYLTLISSEVEVNVENQVAIVTATQKFKNERNNERKNKRRN